MPNPQNVKPYEFKKGQVDRQAAAIAGKKGAERTKEVKREKANFKKAVEIMLECGDFALLDEQLNKLGITTEHKDLIRKWLDFLQLKLLSKNSKPSDILKFIEFARDTIGQNPIQKQEFKSNQPIQIIIKDEDKNC